MLPAHLQTGRDREVLGPGEHPFPTRYAIRTSGLSRRSTSICWCATLCSSAARL
jgi:hypothetical protein